MILVFLSFKVSGGILNAKTSITEWTFTPRMDCFVFLSCHCYWLWGMNSKPYSGRSIWGQKKIL